MQSAETGSFRIFDAGSYKVGIVVSQFNSSITEQLLESAIDKLTEYKLQANDITIIKVAGSVEIPLVLQQLAQAKKYNCLIALGAVIRGDTSHFDYVCKFVTEGILRVQLDNNIPIGFGILTCDTQAQAQKRVSAGGGFAEAALQSAHTIESL